MTSNFDSYQIYYKTTTGETYTYYDTSSSLTPVLSSLTPNTNYYIRLIPYSNTSGLYGSTIDTSSTTLAKLTSASVTSVDTSNQITIGWAGSYSNVKVYYSTDDSVYTQYGTTAYTGTSVSVKPLSTNQQYYFRVDPYNSVSLAGTSVYVKDTSAVTMGYISTFSAPSSDVNKVTLNWNGIYSSAIIYYDTVNGGETNSTTISTASTTIGSTQSIDITSLSSSTTYYFKIKPYNSNNLAGIPMSVSKATPSTKITFTFTNTPSFTTTTSSSYKLYGYTSTSSFTFSYSNIGTVKTLYILAVGGGGAGGYDRGGGGGGGGVVQKSILLPIGSDSVTVSIGGGGSSKASNGGNTTFTFTTNTSLNVVSYGGGYGGGYTNQAGGSGGSGGGGSFNQSGGSQSTNASNAGNSGNSGGNCAYGGLPSAAGGGGAGSQGSSTTSSTVGGDGGNGIQTSSGLLGIYDNYSTNYWGGGGGGCGVGSGAAGSGRNGGGNGSNSGNGSAGTSNTGGGGGGAAGGSYSGGNGGSGILVFSILASDVA